MNRAIIMCAGLCLTATAFAADPVTSPTAPPTTTSLDAALGLIAPTAPSPIDAGKQKLESLLDGSLEQAEGDDFKEAVALMGQSAIRLREASDTSVQTQRVQEEAVRKLDALIAKAKKNQQSQCNNSCDNPENQKEKDKQDQASKPKQSQQSQQERQQGKDSQSTTAEAPRATDPNLRPALESARAAWGNLPQRLRQTLMQGAGDTFSKSYQRMTEEYYKRLGEQAE